MKGLDEMRRKEGRKEGRKGDKTSLEQGAYETREGRKVRAR